MEISIFDPCSGINFKTEEPVELDDPVMKSSQKSVSKDVNVVPEKDIKVEDRNFGNPADVNLDELGIIRDNQSSNLEESFKHECDSDKAPGVDDLVTDRGNNNIGVVFIRTNRNPI